MTKVVEEEGKDPEYKAIGIVTLEDIMGEILMDNEEDEDHIDGDDLRGERKRLKEKLVLLFSE